MARAAHDRSPEAQWAALAPLLAARGRMRVSKDLGRNYRFKDERPVSDRLPASQPAAVLIYDRTGCAPVICLDLDSSRGGVEAVARDYAALTRLLDRMGARWFSDTSPNGGRHIYVPLAEPVPFPEASRFTRALAARTPTLDPLPMLNVQSGCIRPPGARHRSGGHQSLDQSIAAAVDAMRRPTSVTAWTRLLEDTGALDDTDPLTPPANAASSGPPGPGRGEDDAETRIAPLRGIAAPDTTFTTIARTGDWPRDKYRSASEARQGVLWACAAAGWSLADVARRMSDGTWPGLASFYARYSAPNRHTSLVRDWRNAIAFETRRRQRAASEQGTRPVRQCTTSPHKSQGAGVEGASAKTVNREVRVWLAAVDLLTRDADPSVRAVLYALAEAAALTDDLVVEHGNRSLSIATGLDQSTVGRILRSLRAAPSDRLLVDLVRGAEGVRANAYVLVIPPLLRPACERKPWRRGRIHAVRPVFRELGLVAAFVYAALEQAREPSGGRDLARVAGVGHTAAYDALHVLASWGLAEKSTTGGWILGSASPARLAEQFGIDVQVAEQIAKYRAERLAWWRFLGLVDAPPPQEGTVVLVEDWNRAPPDDENEAEGPDVIRETLPEHDLLRRPDDDVAGLVDLLERALGAQVIGEACQA